MPQSKRTAGVIFVFVIAVFAILTVRSEIQTAAIRENAYQECRIRNENVIRLNGLYASIVEIERHNPDRITIPRTVQARIALYTQAQLAPAPCKR